jgi:hypothetical protein
VNVDKIYYLRAALHGLKRDPRLSEAALTFFHCNVAPATAREYLETLQGKLK